MTYSIAISVKDPTRVTKALVEIWQGRTIPLPLLPNSYIVMAQNDQGTPIEVYPSEIEYVLSENDEAVEFFYDLLANRFTGTYDAIPVPASQQEIEQIAAREGWRVVSYSRGMTKGIELWIENQILLVLLPERTQSNPIPDLASHPVNRIVSLSTSAQTHWKFAVS